VASLAFEGSAENARATIERLRTVVERELRSKLDESPFETGELGFDDHYDRAHLTITLGIGSSAFDALGVAPDERPQDLQPIPWKQFGKYPFSVEARRLRLIDALSDTRRTMANAAFSLVADCNRCECAFFEASDGEDRQRSYVRLYARRRGAGEV
jgi:Dyp-type peroxidase family